MTLVRGFLNNEGNRNRSKKHPHTCRNFGKGFKLSPEVSLSVLLLFLFPFISHAVFPFHLYGNLMFLSVPCGDTLTCSF